jgi:nucleoid-associated protein YgaU
MYVRRKRTTLMPAVALAALGAIVAMPLLSSPRLHAASPEHFKSVVIERGQTLWTLAEEGTTVDGNVQETVDRIMAANHLESAAVYPGERLRIPR